jgi:hypothetical protein
MKKTIITTLLSLPCFLITGNALAVVDVSFIPRAGIGYTYYSFEWGEHKPTDPESTLVDVDVNLLTGTLGGTFTVDNFYFDAYLQKSTTGSDEYQLANRNTPHDWDVDIFDYSLTMGYNVWRSLAVYGGWKGHQTDLDGSRIGETWQDYEFNSEGWFTGLSYGIPIGENNLLSFNAAYAWLEADMKGHQIFSAETDTGWPAGTNREFKADNGDATGITLGASWKGYLTDALSYTASVDWYAYNYEDFQTEYSRYGGTLPERPWYQTDVTNTADEQSFSARFTINYDL